MSIAQRSGFGLRPPSGNGDRHGDREEVGADSVAACADGAFPASIGYGHTSHQSDRSGLLVRAFSGISASPYTAGMRAAVTLPDCLYCWPVAQVKYLCRSRLSLSFWSITNKTPYSNFETRKESETRKGD